MIQRLQKVTEEFAEKGIDALFVTNQTNVSYLTGFSGLSPNEREAFLLVTKNKSYLLTFPTYYGLYCQKGDGFETLNITIDKKLHMHLSDILSREKIKKVGLEKSNLTLSEYESLQNKVPVQFLLTDSIVENARVIKTEKEISLIHKAAQITDKTYDYIKSQIKPGVSEKELALKIEFSLKNSGADLAFAPIVAFGFNTAIPHYLPNNKKLTTKNNLILFDFGAKVNDYCSDMTRVCFLGVPDTELAQLYEVVLSAQVNAFNSIKPGVKGDLIDHECREYITKAGFPPYPHGLGHGVGLNIHEDPRLKFGNEQILRANMVVTVEPGIYLEGKYGIRIEDLVVLKKGGIEVVSKSPKFLRESIL